jgi:aminodeoxyfutalosine deaminase
MLEAGLMVTLNSDDPPMFDTDLTNEYLVAARMGLSATTLIQLARNGVHASFASESIKAAILSGIDRVAEHFAGFDAG